MELSHIFTSHMVAGITIIFTLLLFIYHALLPYTPRLLFPAHPNKILPPEARGGWPLIGHLHQLIGPEPTHITLAKMADAYRPIFTLRLGSYKALIVSNWEIARECFTTNDKIFASRPKLVAGKILGYDYAMFGASPYGPYWRKARKLAVLKLLTTQRIDKFRDVRRSEIRRSIKRLYELCGEKGNKVLVDMKKWFGDITLNTIFRMVVGKGYSTAFDGSGDEKYQTALRLIFELFGVFTPSDSFPFLEWLDLGGHQKAMKKTAKVIDHMFDKWLKEHQQRRNSRQTTERDFMDVMLSAVQDEEFSEYHPDIVTKAICMIVPCGPIAIPHESMEDCTIAGYHIPARTRLIVHIQKIQRDPLVWDNPCEFKPERFLTSQKDFDFRGKNPQYIPFGTGRRMCPGVSFALPVLHMTLANLLHGFEIDRPSEELVDMEESVGITSIKKNPLEVMISPRLPVQVYEAIIIP